MSKTPPASQQSIEEQTENVKNKLRDNLTDGFIRLEAQLFNDILQDSAKNRTKLPEEIFVRHFLPFFSGKQPVSDHPQIVAEWIGIAKSPTAEVDVVGHNNETLFTVPAYFDTTVINAAERTAMRDVGTIVNKYIQEKNNLPQIATRNVTQALDQKVPTMFQASDNFQKNKECWKQIFSRYSIQGFNEEEPAESTKKQSPADELDYGD